MNSKLTRSRPILHQRLRDRPGNERAEPAGADLAFLKSRRPVGEADEARAPLPVRTRMDDHASDRERGDNGASAKARSRHG